MYSGAREPVAVSDCRRSGQIRSRYAGACGTGAATGGPDDRPAVIAAGPGAASRTSLIAALLGETAPPVRPPEGSYLRIRYGVAVTGVAHLPGQRQPQPYPGGLPGDGSTLARPPRRVELTVPDPLLRQFDLVDTPESGSLGLAGQRVLLDVLDLGGALLFTLPADRQLSAADRDLLTRAAGSDVAIFMVLTPGTDGSWTGPGCPEADPPVGPVAAVPTAPSPHRTSPTVRLAAQQEAAVAAVPALAGAPWFAVDPSSGDTAPLRRALTDWAGLERLRRVGTGTQVREEPGRPVRVAPAVTEFDWADALDRTVRTAAHRIRQNLALELANIHLRGVQEIVFGTGCPGFPAALDREMHALSLTAVAECDEAVKQLLDSALTRIFGELPRPAVRCRIGAAVTRGFADLRSARDLDRVLLVTSTGGVAIMTGFGAVDTLAAYPGGRATAVLPPLGIALSGGCYQLWCNPASADPGRARSWLQRVLREVELELLPEVSRRFEAVRLSLTSVLGEVLAQGALQV